MKKIYISADIEGIWGNSNPANTSKNGYLYSEYCTNYGIAIAKMNGILDRSVEVF